MLGNLFGRKKEYQPVFPEGASPIVCVADVPRIVAALAKSFRNHAGERVNIEQYWLYTGTHHGAFDQARFPRTIGFHHPARDVLDRLVDATATTLPAIAVLQQSQSIGIRLHSYLHEISAPDFSNERSVFIASKEHLLLDRPLAGYLNPDLQQQLTQAVGKDIREISEQDLCAFVLDHPGRSDLQHFAVGAQHSGETLVTIPASMTGIHAIGTQHANYPLRGLYEQMRQNRFQQGERIADGHIHEALTPRRIGGDAWLQKLADRYGPVKAAATLSLYDAEQLMQMENLGPRFGIAWVQYAAREIFVIDDEGDVKGHSILNMDALSDADFARFVDVSKVSLSGPSNADARLQFHDMIQEYTTQKPIDEPMTPGDYS